MRADKLVAYYRLSTARQEASGLGPDQRQAVAAFLGGAAVLAEFTETESGKRTDRPELARAIGACRLYGARLVIAKPDRLSRDAHFLLGLEKAGVDFVAADMPHASRLTVGIMVSVAEEERRMISTRTKAALAAARARATVLGGYRGTRSRQPPGGRQARSDGTGQRLDERPDPCPGGAAHSRRHEPRRDRGGAERARHPRGVRRDVDGDAGPAGRSPGTIIPLTRMALAPLLTSTMWRLLRLTSACPASAECALLR